MLGKETITSKEHYPYVTRSLARLFNEGRLTNVKDVIVEPEYGYTARIEYKNDKFRVIYGNDLGLNTGASADLAKDKGFTKFMLRSIGVECPEGKEFLMPWWADAIRPSQEQRGNTNLRTYDQAFSYIYEQLAYPVYVKPIQGSKGGDVYRVENDNELFDIFAIYEDKKIRAAVVERAINMPDYRVVMLDGQLISAYERIPLAVTGNGLDSTVSLIEKLQEQYRQEGRDTHLNAYEPRIVKRLGKLGLGLDYIPAQGEKLTLASISNLSAGGTSRDVSDVIAPRWIELAANIAKNFNLRLCGVDLACHDITSDGSEYSVLEVNAAPGLDHYASSGDNQRKIVDELYVKVLNTSQKD